MAYPVFIPYPRASFEIAIHELNYLRVFLSGVFLAQLYTGGGYDRA